VTDREAEPASDCHRDARSHASHTSGHLLGGRVSYTQPRDGFRSGIEPVLLAASIPARSGERVLEGGTGAGATLLCLAARVPGVLGVGIERDERLVALAARNAAANEWPGLHFVAADMASPPDLGMFDHACANPPYHLADGTPSPDASRRAAKRAPAELLAVWAAALAHPLRPRGTLTFILPAALLPAGIAAFDGAGCRPTAMLPLWPKAAQPAKLLLLRGVKGAKAPFRVLSGFVLHEPDGGFTAEAEDVLRQGSALALYTNAW
jgi:tRNA1(Val) A37 N6-methylase TrmN6